MEITMYLDLESEVPRTASPGAFRPPVVPRVICIPVDLFGEHVLRLLDQEFAPQLGPDQRRLTAYLPIRGEAKLTSDVFVVGQDKPVAKDHAAPAAWLRPLLHQARQRICAQTAYRELMQRGWQIGECLEVYIIISITSPIDVLLLRSIVTTARGYLGQFEAVRLVGLLNLSAFDRPSAVPDERNKVIAELETLLKLPRIADDNALGQSMLDRCYIMSEETLHGHAIIPPEELMMRSAGFLAAHYLQGLRQPRTLPQYFLFGNESISNPDQNPNTGNLYGLCDVFGYAELRFTIDPVLDWCSQRHAAEVASLLLSSNEASAEAGPQPELPADLEALGLATPAQKHVEAIVRRMLSGSSARPNDASCEFRALQRRYRQTEQFLRDSKQQAHTEIAAIEQELTGAIDTAIEKHLLQTPAGLLRVEALLQTVEARLRSDLQALQATLEHNTPPADMHAQVQHAHTEMQRRWYTQPTTRLLSVRSITLLILAICAGLGIGGPPGWAIAGGLLMFILCWWIAARLIGPMLLQRRYSQYTALLAEYQQSAVESSVSLQLMQLYKRLLIRFSHASSNIDATQNYWQQLDDWRTKLRQVRDRCLTDGDYYAERLTTRAAQAGSQGQIVLASSDLDTYYRRLTTRAKELTAKEFLHRLDASSRVRWKELRADDLAAQLIDICRRQYQRQASQQNNGLENYLLEIANTGETRVALMLDALLQEATPMTRIYRLHATWEPLRQRCLIVFDAARSIFREAAAQQRLNLIGGASEQQVICIWTEHAIPIRDLALGHAWLPPAEPTAEPTMDDGVA
jgi:hypothetical protein